MKKVLLLIAILAIFSCSKEETPTEPSKTFKLSTSVSPSEGGTITGLKETYNDGEEAKISAVPAEDYNFVEWQGDFTGTENPVTVRMASDKNVTALFEKKTYSLNFDIIGKWYIQSSETNSTSANKNYNKQSDSNCSVYSIEFRKDGTYILITDSNEYNGQFVIIGNKSIDLGAGKLEDLEFINDVLSFSLTLNSGCSSDVAALLLTYVPDDAFEKELIRLGYDSTLNNFVKTENIKPIKTLQLEPSPQIIDFTGLEDFINLETLKVYTYQSWPDYVENPATLEIDFSSNIHLQYLQLDGVPLTDLNLENNPLIETVFLSLTRLTGTVSFPGNPLLREVAITENYQQPRANIDLDFTNNLNLEYFWSDDTWIGYLDISNNQNIQWLGITESVGEIIFNGTYKSLTHLEIIGSSPYRKDIDFAKFPNLEGLNITFYPETIDLSSNLKLKSLSLHADNLTSLDLSFNSLLESFSFGSYDAAKFDCIKVNAEQLSKLETGEYTWYTNNAFTYSIQCQ